MGDAAVLNAHQDTRDFLHDVLGLTNNGLKANIIRGGFTNVPSLARRNDKFISKLATTIRKSGGPAPTTAVTVHAEECLEKARVFSVFLHITQRPLDFTQMTLANMEKVSNWYTTQPEDGSSDDIPIFKEKSNKRIWFESIDNFASTKRGAAGMPVAYLLREAVAHALLHPNAIWNEVDPDFDADLKARGRHDGHFYRSDNVTLYNVLFKLVHDTTASATLVPFAPRRDGRGAYLAYKGSFLGTDVQQVLLRRAETFLEHAYFDGTSRNFTFTTFSSKMRQAFIDLGPNDQMTERRKVTKLMNAFQVKSLSHLDAMITHDPILSVNFEAAVAFLQDQMAAQQLKNKGSRPRNVSNVSSASHSNNTGGNKSPHKKWSKSKFNKKQPHLYLSKSEWMKLSDEEKAAAREARKKKGIATTSDRRQVSSVAQQLGNVVIDVASNGNNASTTTGTNHSFPRSVNLTVTQRTSGPHLLTNNSQARGQSSN